MSLKGHSTKCKKVTQRIDSSTRHNRRADNLARGEVDDVVKSVSFTRKVYIDGDLARPSNSMEDLLFFGRESLCLVNNRLLFVTIDKGFMLFTYCWRPT